jgi:hypothetical protein
MRLLPAMLCAILAATAAAADNPAAENFTKAMAGDDPYAKRAAIQALVDKSVDDTTALTLLVQAVGDRQGRDPAIQALRARTGLKAPAYRGSSRYPGYPSSDDAADWQTWLAERNKEEEVKRKLAKLDPKKVAPAKPATDTEPAVEKPAAVEPAPRIQTDDLGKVDRIIYKSGRSLIAYVRSKRLDADGNLVSVRVVHKGGAGEEVIDASTIARIEEDVE